VEFTYVSDYAQSGVIEIEAKSVEEAAKIVQEMDNAGDLQEYAGRGDITGTDFIIEEIAEVK